MSSTRMRLSVARWMRLPMASGTRRAARIPSTTRSTGTRFSSAEASLGKLWARKPIRKDLTRPTRSPSRRRSAVSLERPKALMGAFTTLVSPRLLPVREWPITIEGSSCATRRPFSTR